jgi:hypothetical protein
MHARIWQQIGVSARLRRNLEEGEDLEIQDEIIIVVSPDLD